MLLPDVEPQLEFAAAAFGCAPEAVNLWIGDERSTTTFHKDHYENLYAVLRGKKVFHLLPPTDVYRMGLQLYPAAQYEPVSQQCNFEGFGVMICPCMHAMCHGAIRWNRAGRQGGATSFKPLSLPGVHR